MPSNTDKVASASAAHTLVALCSGLLPVWARHLAASRSQSEVAVSEMMQAFSSISPHVQLAERQSLQLSEAIGQVPITGLAQACATAIEPLLQHPQLPSGGVEAIQSVLSLVRNAVGTLEQVSQPLSQETQVVAEQVERMYMGFQYQDRISQMMSLLEEDISRLQVLMDGDAADVPNLQHWLGRLETQYAMVDQRAIHAGEAGTAPYAGPDQETTFF
jgi:methyl-accepting chemotaxis protein